MEQVINFLLGDFDTISYHAGPNIIQIVLVIGLTVFIFKSRKSTVVEGRKKMILSLVTSIYLIALFSVTLFPLRVLSVESIQKLIDSKALLIPDDYLMLMPFGEIFQVITDFDWRYLIIQVIGNILLFIPFPILLAMLNEKLTFQKILLKGFLLTVSIELIQLVINFVLIYPNRVASIDDVILNLLGVLLGYQIWKLMKNVGKRALSRI